MDEQVRDTIVACVRTGDRYPMEYLTKLRNMVDRHMPRPYRMICLTDQPERCSGVQFIDVAQINLPGWWAKMILFAPEWRGFSKVLYFDLDTVIRGDLAPLASVPSEVAILESPVRASGNLLYPCKYNSSVMVLRAGLTDFIWKNFIRHRDQLMHEANSYGDQKVIELLYRDADILNKMLPGFFLNYRNLTNIAPEAAVINFGGAHKPANCAIPWVIKAWA